MANSKKGNAEVHPETAFRLIDTVSIPLPNGSIQTIDTKAMQTPHGCLVHINTTYVVAEGPPGFVTCSESLQYLPGVKIQENEGVATLVAL